MERARQPLNWGILVTIGFVFVFPALGKDIEEKFDDGTPHIRYKTDGKDHKIGGYEEFFPGGKIKLRGTYTADKKSGTWSTFGEDGKPLEVAHYRNGVLEGPYQWNFPSGHQQLKATYHADDFAGPITTYDEKGHTLLRLSYPRPFDMVLKAWKTLAPKTRDAPKFIQDPHVEAPYVAGKIAPESLEAALKYTMLYRFLSGLPFQNMVIDPQGCDLSQHGAVVVAKLGHLTHQPEKPPDMDDSFYKLAYAGCGHSNLHQGQSNLFDAIDGFMDDSDPTNIMKVGHRMWLLSPGYQQTGFGAANGFVAMYVGDNGISVPNLNFYSYPGEGYYPRSMLHDTAAWSVDLISIKARVPPASDLAINVVPLDEHFVAGETKMAKIVNVLGNETSNWHTIIFQPQIPSLTAGRYLVEISGLRTPTGIAVPFSYLVHLKDMPPPDEDAKPARESAAR